MSSRSFPCCNRAARVLLLMLTTAAVCLSRQGPARGGDWPQILGPNRNGIAVEEKLADKWPKDGPRSLWEANVGAGFAGVAVAEGVVILFHRLADEDTLSAYDAESGKSLWSQGFPTNFQPAIVEDGGPRAVPTIHQGRVYALAAAGGLYCVDIKSGKPVWQRQTSKEFHVPSAYFGAGSSPLIEGKTLILNVGGDKDKAGIVAFDINTGKTVWQATPEQASYSSPIITTLDDQRVLLCVTRLNFVALDPATGKELARTPFGQRGPTVNGAIPVLIGQRVLLTASYGIGAELVRVSRNKFDIVWQDEVLSSQYTTPIVYDGAVYGIDGRQDGGPISLKCFDPETRKVHWTETGLAYATLIAADGKLLVMHTNGTARLAELNKAEYRELDTANLLRGTTRALPALANGRLYVRNEQTLKCIQLKP